MKIVHICLAVIVVLLLAFAYKLGQVNGSKAVVITPAFEAEEESTHFVGNSAQYLNGYKIDVPEELTVGLSDRTHIHMILENKGDNVLGLRFHPEEFGYVHRDYQLMVDNNGITIFRGMQAIDRAIWGKSSVEEAILNDAR